MQSAGFVNQDSGTACLKSGLLLVAQLLRKTLHHSSNFKVRFRSGLIGAAGWMLFFPYVDSLICGWIEKKVIGKVWIVCQKCISVLIKGLPT